MGKTRLLRELSDRASDQGCLVLHGRAAEFERELPVRPLRRRARQLPRGGSGERVQHAARRSRSTSSPRAFPAMRPLATGATQAPAPDDRVRVHRAVRELIGGLAPGKAILITLDDLQWSDRASLELVGHLMRRPPRARRADRIQLPNPAPRLRRDDRDRRRRGARDPRAGCASRPWSATRRRRSSVGDGSNGDTLYEDSGGNPFYLLELARLEQIARPGRCAAADGGASRGGRPRDRPRARSALRRTNAPWSTHRRSSATRSAWTCRSAPPSLEPATGPRRARRARSIRPRPPHRRAAALPVPPSAGPRGDLRRGPIRDPARDPRRLRRPSPRRQRRARRARAPRRAGGAAGRHRGGRAAPGRRPRVGGPRAGERRAVAARGAATAPGRRRPGRSPGAAAAPPGAADLARAISTAPTRRPSRRSRPSGEDQDDLRVGLTIACASFEQALGQRDQAARAPGRRDRRRGGEAGGARRAADREADGPLLPARVPRDGRRGARTPSTPPRRSTTSPSRRPRWARS